MTKLPYNTDIQGIQVQIRYLTLEDIPKFLQLYRTEKWPASDAQVAGVLQRYKQSMLGAFANDAQLLGEYSMIRNDTIV